MKMLHTEHIWMTRREHTRLLSELAELRSGRSIEVPDDFMDHDAKFVAGYSARKARIREIENLLATAIVGEDLAGKIAEPGMVLTIRYEATGETETFLLGRHGAQDADIKVYSTLSPLGRAIAGARPGEQRIYSIPHEANLVVTLIDAVPYGPRRRRITRPAPRGRSVGSGRSGATTTACGRTTQPASTASRRVV